MHRLVGKRLPSFDLPSTHGGSVNPAALDGHTVIVCYPYTGKTGVADPPGWDEIPGAHGSTPQCIAYSGSYERFQKQKVKLFGLSFLSLEWQSEFAERTGLKFALLSDETRLFATSLALPTFMAGSSVFLRRLTLICRDGTIIGAHEPSVPERDATETLALFERT